MADVTDERLQDYLDGRLSDRERAEVETAIGDDPELARRIAAWREIGGALRSGDDELPPGFYARARGRFEQTTRPRSRFGFRILSWEVAGLAAAVLLAGVVFIPEMMRDPDLGRAPGAPLETRSDTARAEPPARLEVKKEARDLLSPDDAAQAPETTFADEVAPLEELEEVEDKAMEMQQTIREPVKHKVRAELEPDPATTGRASAVATPEAGKRSRGQVAAPAPAEVDADVAEPEPEGLGLLGKSERFAEQTAPTGPQVSAAGAMLPHVVRLPASAEPPEGLTVLDTRPDWDAWLAGPAGPALSELGSPDPAKRLVVVGRAEGLNCAGLGVAKLENRYSLRLSVGSSAGCALLLPRDGLPIGLE